MERENSDPGWDLSLYPQAVRSDLEMCGSFLICADSTAVLHLLRFIWYFSDSGLSDHRLRICSRQRQPEKLCHFLPQVRAKGPALALQRLYRNGRLLPTDDVLHHGNRLDAVLLFRYLTGSLTSQSMTTEQVSSYFSNMLASPGTMILL